MMGQTLKPTKQTKINHYIFKKDEVRDTKDSLLHGILKFCQADIRSSLTSSLDSFFFFFSLYHPFNFYIKVRMCLLMSGFLSWHPAIRILKLHQLLPRIFEKMSLLHCVT